MDQRTTWFSIPRELRPDYSSSSTSSLTHSIEIGLTALQVKSDSLNRTWTAIYTSICWIHLFWTVKLWNTMEHLQYKYICKWVRAAWSKYNGASCNINSIHPSLSKSAKILLFWQYCLEWMIFWSVLVRDFVYIYIFFQASWICTKICLQTNKWSEIWNWHTRWCY